MQRIALAGLGFIGRTHAARILANNELKLVAIVDRDVHSLEESLRTRSGNFDGGDLSIEKLKGVALHTTLEECLDTEEVDCVDICLPTMLHHPMTKLALERGKHVLLEKPFVLDPEQGRELIALAKKVGCVFMVAQVVRFMPEYAYVKECLGKGTYGPLRFLSLFRKAGAPTWGDWTKSEALRRASGGGLFDLAIHDIDFMRHVLGEPSSISCATVAGALSPHDHVNATWAFRSGAVGMIQSGLAFHSATPFEARYQARFEKATLEFSSLKPGVVRVSDDRESREMKIETEPDGFQREIDYFAACVAGNERPADCLPETSLRAIELAHLHRQSAEKGEPVHA